MNAKTIDKQPVQSAPESTSRRRLLTGTAAAASVGGFFGPWAVHHAWAHAAAPKPLVIGLTMDASGQYGASGGKERLGATMAIQEFHA
jgi:branched-chain amino acid transport system substrate-binding protein